MEDPMYNLMRYLRILEGSEDFQKQIKKITAHYNNDIKAKKKHSLHKDITNLMKIFYIPNKENYHSHLVRSILDSGKFKDILTISIPASKEFNTMPFQFEESGIIIHIKQKLNRSDWEDLWHEDIEKLMEKEELFNYKHKSDYLRKPWENIDLLLDMYRKIQKGATVKSLTAELSKKRSQARANNENTKYPSPSEGNIRRRIAKLKDEIKAL